MKESINNNFNMYEIVFYIIDSYINIDNTRNRKILESEIRDDMPNLQKIFVNDKVNNILNSIYDNSDIELKNFISDNFELNQMSSWQDIYDLRNYFVKNRIEDIRNSIDLMGVLGTFIINNKYDVALDHYEDLINEYGTELEEKIDEYIYKFGMKRTSDKLALDSIIFNVMENDLEDKIKLKYCKDIIKCYLYANSKSKKLRKN